ncbi:MAG TPA: hypothetical protein DD635_01695 [Flavobacteriales bacterium]|nr:hypothetical protein [Flavobacteriales bacterium]
MSNSLHPVRKTIIFFVAVWMGIFAFMARPHSHGNIFSDWPRWTESVQPVATMSPIEARMILEGYSAPMREIDPVDSTADLLSPPPIPATVASSQRPELSTAYSTGMEPEKRVSEYDRGAIDTFLHKDLQLVGNSQAFDALGNFFAALNAATRKPAIHVLHYGDSQIEGDRITGHLRNAWQSIWGGSGPGFLSPLSPVPSMAMRQSWSGDWRRYARFGKRDTTIQHDRFGLMAAFAQPDNVRSDSMKTAATLRFEPHPRGYKRNRTFNQLHLALGKVIEPTTMQLTINESETISVLINPDTLAQHLSLRLDALDSMAFESLELQFDKGYPEINGIGMWADSGIVVHNLAMRGSSGTVFRQLDRKQFSRQLGAIRTELIMLQYGGNVVPYITNTEAAQRYADWFTSQIRLFQSLLPQKPIIVIGPSDMAQKAGVLMETYPQLTLIRDALKEAVFANNALYWDVFEVMGGEGSMAAWVKSDPPLASSDHIHFTPAGAKQIAELFRQSIQAEWTLWQNTQAERTLVHEP